MVKEGSIGYLLVKMPWSGEGCEVEVNELELVVSPCIDNISTTEDEVGCSDVDKDTCEIKYSSNKTKHETVDDAMKSMSVDVHEGAKTIAKMIKWLLTSFHVKITNVIVAFDPSLENEGKEIDSNRTLVLRVSEIQCGTSLSEDTESNVDVLGISQLTNFVKFDGAVLEILKIDNENNQLPVQHVSEAGCGDPILGSNKSTCPVITGKQGGFDVCVDPVVLRFQPSSIEWLLKSWGTLKNSNKDAKGSKNHSVRGSSHLNSALLCPSSTSVSITNVTGEMKTGHGSSGMWNLTCSVFSAITAASSLASGSLHIPSGT
ncbi:hypothetical protein TSUD_144990 [Trifolium subterraneum]|uniref:Autophagy-related protein 2 n=1 Tax=Trifolium subterraneum TaxID=3900 RepID=A0A2Z6N7T1_TRISU|nr:hypothetical protein TSUD_144990 [Trifolium subterraneum]